MNQCTLVWDAPTRAFHWLLALSFAGAFVTAESERFRDIHLMFGYTLLGLVGFRVVWGFVGTRYARFRSFLFGRRELADYLRSLARGKPRHYLGHNPAGSIAVFLLLGLGLLTGITGLGADRGWGEGLHEASADGMLAVVLVHVAGVVVSSVLHRENLVRAMITGYKAAPDSGIRRAHGWLAVLLAAAVALFWLLPQAPDPAGAERAAARILHHEAAPRAGAG